MSNYDEDDSYYQQNLYTNTYSLWENSAYYDTNKLSPRNFPSIWHRGNNNDDFVTFFSSGPTETKASALPEPPEPPEPPDYTPRGVVDRASLYEYPDLFYQDVTEENATPPPLPDWTPWQFSSAESSYEGCNREENATPPPIPDWTPWQFSSAESSYEGCNREENATPPPISDWTPWQFSSAESSYEGCSSSNRGNTLQNNYDRMFPSPVKMNKLECMMQRIGSSNQGALGMSGTGIIEPKAPNPVHATKKKGFGRNKAELNKEQFAMDVLHKIHEFVKNNREVELLFDAALTRQQRKQIQNIVKFMRNMEDMSVMNYETRAQLDMMMQIFDVNCYILQGQSFGEDPNRQFCICKEAPHHVYLIIPEDLRDEPPADEPPDDEVSENEPEEETNPFLRSITRNLKKTKEVEKVQKVKPVESPKKTRVLDKIFEYFAEFVEKKEYTEFKFLGPFTSTEWKSISTFLINANLWRRFGSSNFQWVFDKVSYNMSRDITGNTVITKNRC